MKCVGVWGDSPKGAGAEEVVICCPSLPPLPLLLKPLHLAISLFTTPRVLPTPHRHPQVELRKMQRERDDAYRAASNLKEALTQQRAAADLELASAKAVSEAAAAVRWQGRVTDLRKQVRGCGWF